MAWGWGYLTSNTTATTSLKSSSDFSSSSSSDNPFIKTVSYFKETEDKFAEGLKDWEQVEREVLQTVKKIEFKFEPLTETQKTKKRWKLLASELAQYIETPDEYLREVLNRCGPKIADTIKELEALQQNDVERNDDQQNCVNICNVSILFVQEMQMMLTQIMSELNHCVAVAEQLEGNIAKYILEIIIGKIKDKLPISGKPNKTGASPTDMYERWLAIATSEEINQARKLIIVAEASLDRANKFVKAQLLKLTNENNSEILHEEDVGLTNQARSSLAKQSFLTHKAPVSLPTAEFSNTKKLNT